MTILSKCKMYIVGVVFTIATLIGLYIKGKNDGEKSEKNKQLKGKINAVNKANKARNSLHQSDTVNKLRTKYGR